MEYICLTSGRDLHTAEPRLIHRQTTARYPAAVTIWAAQCAFAAVLAEIDGQVAEDASSAAWCQIARAAAAIGHLGPRSVDNPPRDRVESDVRCAADRVHLSRPGVGRSVEP